VVAVVVHQREGAAAASVISPKRWKRRPTPVNSASAFWIAASGAPTSRATAIAARALRT
jgi:hypothetical protein